MAVRGFYQEAGIRSLATNLMFKDPPTQEGCAILAEEALTLRRQTFESLYRRYFWSLVGFCRASVRSRAVAEDAAQESFLRAYKYLHTLDTGRSPWPWLKAIARNVLADRAGRDREIPLATAEDWCGPEEQVSAEDRMILRGAMAGLPDSHRRALHLRYVEGWEPRAAAAFLDLSVPAFNQLVFRARARFREELAKLGRKVPAIVAGPFHWARARLYRMAARNAGVEGPTAAYRFSSEALFQIAGGVVAILVFTGTPYAPAGELPRHPALPEVVQIATASVERATHPRPAKDDGSQASSVPDEVEKADKSGPDASTVTGMVRKVQNAAPDKAKNGGRIKINRPSVPCVANPCDLPSGDPLGLADLVDAIVP